MGRQASAPYALLLSTLILRVLFALRLGVFLRAALWQVRGLLVLQGGFAAFLDDQWLSAVWFLFSAGHGLSPP
jgi:hypothetical protein